MRLDAALTLTRYASVLSLPPVDMVFGQYREPGVLMWRGFTLENFADQVRSC